MANTTLQSLLSAVYTTPVFNKNGTMTSAWQLFLTAVVNNSSSGNTGNTTVNTTFGVIDDRNALDQKVADLEQQVLFALDNPAFALAAQAVETQQANNSINTVGDVLDLIRLSETGLILNTPIMYLAALPDSSANLDFTVHWNDLVNGVATANSALGHSNSNVEMQIVGPPNAVVGQFMDVQLLTIVNNDSINANVVLYVSSGATATDILQRVFLQPGYTLIFDENGFRVLNTNGIPLRH